MLSHIKNSYTRNWLENHNEAMRGVKVPLSIIRINEGDMDAAILFSQIIYWHGASEETGAPRLTRKTADGKLWLYKNHWNWQLEVGLNTQTARRAIERIKEKKLIEYFVDETNPQLPVPHMRINEEYFARRMMIYEMWRNFTRDNNIPHRDNEVEFFYEILSQAADALTSTELSKMDSYLDLFCLSNLIWRLSKNAVRHIKNDNIQYTTNIEYKEISFSEEEKVYICKLLRKQQQDTGEGKALREEKNDFLEDEEEDESKQDSSIQDTPTSSVLVGKEEKKPSSPASSPAPAAPALDVPFDKLKKGDKVRTAKGKEYIFARRNKFGLLVETLEGEQILLPFPLNGVEVISSSWHTAKVATANAPKNYQVKHNEIVDPLIEEIFRFMNWDKKTLTKSNWSAVVKVAKELADMETAIDPVLFIDSAIEYVKLFKTYSPHVLITHAANIIAKDRRIVDKSSAGLQQSVSTSSVPSPTAKPQPVSNIDLDVKRVVSTKKQADGTVRVTLARRLDENVPPEKRAEFEKKGK